LFAPGEFGIAEGDVLFFAAAARAVFAELLDHQRQRQETLVDPIIIIIIKVGGRCSLNSHYYYDFTTRLLAWRPP
jgi:hypothetical protein